MEPSDKWMMVRMVTIIHLPEAPNPKVGPPRDTVQEQNEMHFFILWSNVIALGTSGGKELGSKKSGTSGLIDPLVKETLWSKILWQKTSGQ